MENKEILGLLGELREKENNQLVKNVIDIILDECDNDPIEYMKNVLEYGCSSGCVSALIYYVDTEKFFKDNCDDILYLANHYINEYRGVNMDLSSNNLAWFGFEEIIVDLVNRLEIEY